MSTKVFVLVIVALGFGYIIYFARMKKRYDKRHPGKKNPVQFWLKGRYDPEEKHDQDEDQEDK
ncbi:MAG: nucleoside transporter [Desulfovibrionaceae bacterium]|nr:nucleoside transporter [Desulfovibrionaceae bacterium]MDD4952152.1 nucleoside transporter [Desulfovibrionaceae bacterium]